MIDPAAIRILDASLNRARESLRVIEDHARFALDDRDSAAAVKRIRHDLCGIAESIGADRLLDSRDIVGDIGRESKTDAELSRQTIDDVLAAAFGRLTEALRSISEYGKLVSREITLRAEQLRYQSYELEQRILLRGTLRKRFRGVDLYVILTESLCSRGWVDTAEAVLRGGAKCLQLREKSLSDAEWLRRARELRSMTSRYAALCIINDRADIARLAGADGVHVGQDDLSVAEIRRIGGAGLLVGKSTHTPAQIAEAIHESPDYIAVGPMFETKTKPQELTAGPQMVGEARHRTELPIVAIGGIDLDRIQGVIAAGADIVCVCSAVISVADPERAARELSGGIAAARTAASGSARVK